MLEYHSQIEVVRLLPRLECSKSVSPGAEFIVLCSPGSVFLFGGPLLKDAVAVVVVVVVATLSPRKRCDDGIPPHHYDMYYSYLYCLYSSYHV